MSSRSFLLVALPCLILAATALVFADVLDAPALALVGLAAVVAVVVAREAWQWDGRGRQWLLMMGGIVAIVGVAFVASAVTN